MSITLDIDGDNVVDVPYETAIKSELIKERIDHGLNMMKMVTLYVNVTLLIANGKY